jgi:hypothetical protein
VCGSGAFYLPSEAALHDEKKALAAFGRGASEASSCAYLGGANLQAIGNGARLGRLRRTSNVPVISAMGARAARLVISMSEVEASVWTCLVQQAVEGL